MYNAIGDPYCYPNTSILINQANIRNQQKLDLFELAMTTHRFGEPLPDGRYSISHYCAIHRHLFQDVYPWAGKIRTIRISKNGSMFCYPENIKRELTKVLYALKSKSYLGGLQRSDFAVAAAHFLAELNAIHAFRDGNGRVQLAFLALIAFRAGHPLNLERLKPKVFLKIIIESFNGNEELLAVQINKLL